MNLAPLYHSLAEPISDGSDLPQVPLLVDAEDAERFPNIAAAVAHAKRERGQ